MPNPILHSIPKKTLVAFMTALTVLIGVVAKNLDTAGDVKEVVLLLRETTDSLARCQLLQTAQLQRLADSDSQARVDQQELKAVVDSLFFQAKLEKEIERRFQNRMTNYTARKEIAYAEKYEN
jgi:hypothetical protein